MKCNTLELTSCQTVLLVSVYGVFSVRCRMEGALEGVESSKSSVGMKADVSPTL